MIQLLIVVYDCIVSFQPMIVSLYFNKYLFLLCVAHWLVQQPDLWHTWTCNAFDFSALSWHGEICSISRC